MIPAKWRIPLKFARAMARVSGVCLDDQTPTLQKFILIANQRTGSTWIIDLLNSHPHITAYSELFHGANYGRPKVGGNRDILVWNSYAASQGSPRGRLERMRLCFQYLDEEVYRPRNGSGAAGFKLMYNQAAFEIYLLAYLKVRRVSVIHLIRRNHLAGILSEEAVLVRNVAHAQAGSAVAPVQFELDTHTLITRLQARAQSVREAQDFLSQMGTPYSEIYYEDLREDASGIQETMRVLGVDATDFEPSSSLQKLNPTDHRQLIENYDEVHELLKGTAFFDQLH
jgi:LPS sulfotransferase NodH